LTLHRFILSVWIAAAALLVGSCRLGPVDYDKFEQRTIEANLAAIDSALATYQSQLGAGGVDSACARARAFLLTQEGVDIAVIAPDSTVWAFFASGLLAGVGEAKRDTTGSGLAAVRHEPAARVASGGEVWPPVHYVVPFDVGLPGTQRSVDAIRGIFQRDLGAEDEVFTGSQVDIGLVAGLINPGTGLLFWAGHGTTAPRDDAASAFDAALVLGREYSRQSLAEAAVRQFAGYLKAAPGQPRQAAVVRFAGHSGFSLLVLPGFIRAHGDFDNAESLPSNCSKTIVYLSTCFSAYGGADAALMDAFRAAGADLVCGWDWAVHDEFACNFDTTVIGYMADTCLAGEALARPWWRSDPQAIRGSYATFQWSGDEDLLMQTVLEARRGETTVYRSCPGWAVQMYGSAATKLYGFVRLEGSTDDAAMVTFLFPSTAPGSFDLFTSGAYICWDDIASGHRYWAQAGYVGTSGMLDIDECTDSLVVGHFSATFGWWDAGKNPYADQPDDAFSLTQGVLKYSGKITHYGLDALPPERNLTARD
jgi:hypothetical protein